MNPPFIGVESEVTHSGIDHFLHSSEVDTNTLLAQDQLLFKKIEIACQLPRIYIPEVRLHFVNAEVGELARAQYDINSSTNLEEFLTDRGTTDIPIVRGYTIMVDGIEYDVPMVGATELSADGANHGDMSSMLYLRDQIQAASALIELSLQNPERYGLSFDVNER